MGGACLTENPLRIPLTLAVYLRSIGRSVLNGMLDKIYVHFPFRSITFVELLTKLIKGQGKKISAASLE